MQLKRFENAAEFYEQVKPFLVAHEAEHNVLLGICSALIQTDIYEAPPYMAYVEHDGEIVAVAMRTPPYNLVLSDMADDSPIATLVQNTYATYPDLKGIVGLKAISKTFAQTWKAITGQDYRLNIEERLYRLQKVNPVHQVSGEYRAAIEADREILVQWFIDFSVEALDGMSREDAERQFNVRLTSDPLQRGLRVWCDRGKPVSFAGYGGQTPHGIRIGPVYTPPELRGHGYASACVAALSQELLDAGRKFVSLFTDLSNPTSNHIYQTIGYEPVCYVDEYRFEAVS
ncbi:MAG: GNAT family N-acetyltransferase [Chloroflexota bacterium]